MPDPKETIGNFPKQFRYKPVIKNKLALKPDDRPDNFIVVGMGGSHLAGDLVKFRHPDLELLVHHDYNIPAISQKKLSNSRIIFISYSGNTSEVLDAFHKAKNLNLPLSRFAIIACGGKLLELAKLHSVPYIEVPAMNIPPRSSTGFFLRATLLFLDIPYTLQETDELAYSLEPQKFETSGKNLAKRLYGKIPLVYCSTQNQTIALYWKVLLNESGNTPAFFNVFPELNHNEMNPFADNPTTRNITDMFHFIFLRDADDNPEVQKRMTALRNLYRGMQRRVAVVDLERGSAFHKAFSSILLAEWMSYYLAQKYNIDSTEVPMIESFKTLVG